MPLEFYVKVIVSSIILIEILALTFFVKKQFTVDLQQQKKSWLSVNVSTAHIQLLTKRVQELHMDLTPHKVIHKIAFLSVVVLIFKFIN